MAKTRAADRSAAAQVSVRRPDPQAWRHALRLAHGDHRRLEVQSDGTVVVRNHNVR
jgi:hypothetical protein